MAYGLWLAGGWKEDNVTGGMNIFHNLATTSRVLYHAVKISGLLMEGRAGRTIIALGRPDGCSQVIQPSHTYSAGESWCVSDTHSSRRIAGVPNWVLVVGTVNLVKIVKIVKIVSDCSLR